MHCYVLSKISAEASQACVCKKSVKVSRKNSLSPKTNLLGKNLQRLLGNDPTISWHLWFLFFVKVIASASAEDTHSEAILGVSNVQYFLVWMQLSWFSPADRLCNHPLSSRLLEAFLAFCAFSLWGIRKKLPARQDDQSRSYSSENFVCWRFLWINYRVGKMSLTPKFLTLSRGFYGENLVSHMGVHKFIHCFEHDKWGGKLAGSCSKDS